MIIIEINKIVQRINSLLAGETLTFDQLKPHLDSVIDDINSRLNSTFPSFSEFQEDEYGGTYNYDFFPEKYVRSVIAVGAAFYFYTTDEEGIESAVEYGRQYAQNLFYMERDYLDQVPEEYQAGDVGSVHTQEFYGLPAYIDDMF